MEASPLVLEEARCMFEKLIVTRKRELIKLKFVKRLIIYFIIVVIVGSIRSYLAIDCKSLEKGTYERGRAEGFNNGFFLASIIGYVILYIWIDRKHDKEMKALELEISSAEKLNLEESIEEVKRLDELKQKSKKKCIPWIVLLVLCFILGVIVDTWRGMTPDSSSVTTSNGTLLLSNETLGNFSTVSQ